jgi:PAS domain S-box-containing protein
MSDKRLEQRIQNVRISRGLIGLSVLIALAIFLFDLATPHGVAGAIPYVGLVLLSRRSSYPPYAFILATIASVLTILGFFMSPDGPIRIDLANRGLSIFAVWLTAVLCYQHIERVHRLALTNIDLKRQVVDSVTEAVQVVAELQSEREDRKQTEEDLQHAEERFAAIFNQTYQLVAVLDPSGCIAEVNDTFMMACGQQRHDIEGRPIWSIKALAGNGGAQERLRAAVESASGGDFARTELHFIDANDKVLTMDASLKPIRDGDSAIRLLIFEARDITEQQQNLELLHQAQKAEVIGQLTSGIAHDFNNILAIISGHLEMSEGRGRSERRRKDHIRSALEAVFRGRELTQQLLSYSRKRRLRRRRIEVDKLVHESLKLLDRALLKEVEIVTDLADPTWPVLSDPSEMQTALLNLVVNSKDSMPDGGKITIKTANVMLEEMVRLGGVTLAPGEYVLLSVIDEGTGIPADLLSRVTEPYFTTKTQSTGTGLGLSMVSQFARQTGGAVHISSTVGAGTTVTLYLPRNGVSAAVDTDIADEIDAIAEESDGERILVVEDDPNVRRNVVEMLTELGYSVTEAETGAIALTILKKQPDLDLVFSDIALPGGYSGRDLAEEIVRAGNGVKVLLTTGVPDHATHKDLKMANVPVLVKPYRYTELARAIRSVLTH